MVIIKSNSTILMGEEMEAVALNMTAKNLALVDGNSSSSIGSASSSHHASEEAEHHDLIRGILPLPNISFASGRRNSNGNGVDEELTNLTWLQDNNLLKNLRVGQCNANEFGSVSGPGNNSPSSDSVDDSLENIEFEEEEDEYEDFMSAKKSPEADSHLPGHKIAYDPLLHVNSKPPYSFSCLIFMAIEDSPSKALPVKEIYSWIVRHFPYFQQAPIGWKNSVRHNLSLNKCFSKVDKEKGLNVGKGSLWCTDPEFRPNLLQALRKSPYCSFTQLEDVGLQKMPDAHESVIHFEEKPTLVFPAHPNVNVPSPNLFPYLSKRLSFQAVKAYEVDAAATMLALKNGSLPERRAVKGETKEEKKLKRKLYLRLGYDAFDTVMKDEPVTVRVVAYTTNLFIFRSTGESPFKLIKNSSGSDESLPLPSASTTPSVDHTYSACLENNGEDNEEPLNLKHICNNNNNNNNNYFSNVFRESSQSTSSDDDERGDSSVIYNQPPRRKRSRSSADGICGTVSSPGMLEDEDRTLKEGAHALMSLANIAKHRRQTSNKLVEQKRTVLVNAGHFAGR